jgi:hypothetical protein
MDLDYNTRLAAIQRNEKLAQIMQQQAFQPVDIQSYQGIQAPISPLSGLAKVLQAYMGAKGTGDEERIKLNQEAKAQAQQMLGGLQDRPASPGRAAVMGMPEIQAQPATSFTPMGADFEDNPNLQTAPSGNVETPAVAYQPAVAPQAAIPPQAAVSLDPDQKRAKLVEIMMGQNPYASPIAKLEYERLGKQESGPLAEYRLAQQQGYKGTIDQYKTQQAQAGRSINTVNMPSSMAPMFVRNRITGKNEFVQPDNRGKFDMANYEPIDKGTDLRQQLADAGIFPTLPDGTPNPEFTKYAKAALEKGTSLVVAPNASVTGASGVTTQAAPAPPENTQLIRIDGKLIAVPIAQAAELTAKFKGMVAKATGQAEAELDLMTVYDKDGKASFVPRSQAVEAANTGSPLLAKPDVKTTQGQTVLDVAKRAELVLPKASSGIISNLFTMATDAAGIPTDKSAADAQLRVLGGQLTLAQPRMEGPQSNADSILYQQMAAEVANPNRPYQTRMKALNTVIELNEKYAPTSSAPPPGSVRRITPK